MHFVFSIYNNRKTFLTLFSRSLWLSQMIIGHWSMVFVLDISILTILWTKWLMLQKLSRTFRTLTRDFHMFCFSESRLNDHIDDKEVSIAGFHIIRKDALDRKETGLIVYINEHVSFTRLTWYEEYGIECVWLEVKMKKSSPILVGFLYRNPSEPANWVNKFVCSVAGELCKLARVTGPEFPHPFSPVGRCLPATGRCRAVRYKRQCLPGFCTMCWKVLVNPYPPPSLHAEKVCCSSLSY